MMYHIRITGVCLLFLIIAAAIPIGGLASSGMASPGLNSEYNEIPIKESSAVSEVPSALVSPLPLQLYEAQENNTTVNQTELSNISASNTPVSNETAQSTPAPTESNATSTQENITPDMIPDANGTSVNATTPGDITSSIQANATLSMPANATVENATVENATVENATV
ncbi:MAG: hypothetical protein ACE14P_14405, partial [Methanotrichaceae archaeon]